MAVDNATLRVARYRPEQSPEPYFQSYQVPFSADMVVLDALNKIKDEQDGTLSYRWSCRMGVCGSCAMCVNGTPKLTCGTFVRDYLPGEIRVEPLANFPVIRDLVVDIGDFLEKLQEVKPWLIRKTEKPLEQGEHLQTPDEVDRYKQFSMCINCMICYAACPVYGLDSSFVGPAAIALAHRYNMDSRDEGSSLRQPVLMKHEGIWECTFVGECSVVCPKNVDPAAAIQRTKVASVTDWFRSLVMPWSKR